MDIDKILDSQKEELLKEYKRNAPEHLSAENIIKFVYNEFDLTNKIDEEEYSGIIEHLAFCEACQADVKHARSMVEQEAELFAMAEESVSREEIAQTWERFKSSLPLVYKRKIAEQFARNFIENNYPAVKSWIKSAWKAVKNIPRGVHLASARDRLPVLAVRGPEENDSLNFVYQVLFTLINLLEDIPETASREEIEKRLRYHAKINDLPKKTANQLIEYVVNQMEEKD